TGLHFDSIEDCLKAEETMRAEYARVYNDWHAWAEAHPKDAADTQKFMWWRDGMETTATCIPHSEHAVSPDWPYV
ncbi:MAG TPA: hypothetical protein VGN85_02620, partial [Methyloceanibacter sp.]|nr:hypothetical protein [Methyloceanibacter sp.]